MRVWLQFVSGLVLSSLIGLLAYRRRSLSRSGVVGAVIVGTAIFGFGGWVWGMLLIAFFVLSSLLSRYKQAVKARLSEKFAKGGQRDLGQALANGGIGALISVAHLFHPHPAMFAAFVGAMATVNADTWATELGVLSLGPPRLLTTWRPVEPGTSGGVSPLGTLATIAGALAIGLAAALLVAVDGALGGAANALLGMEGVLGGVLLLPSAVLGGVAGSLFDSLLGATVQVMYYSPTRLKETEKETDAQGAANVYLRGWRWLDNDAVNLISSLVGAAVGALIWAAIR